MATTKEISRIGLADFQTIFDQNSNLFQQNSIEGKPQKAGATELVANDKSWNKDRHFRDPKHQLYYIDHIVKNTNQSYDITFCAYNTAGALGYNTHRFVLHIDQKQKQLKPITDSLHSNENLPSPDIDAVTQAILTSLQTYCADSYQN